MVYIIQWSEQTMSDTKDTKSKFPDFKELSSMTSKLFRDIKTSVGQIIQDYKNNRAQSGPAEPPKAPDLNKAEKPNVAEKPKTEELKNEELQAKLEEEKESKVKDEQK
jgi:hypothetical protein